MPKYAVLIYERVQPADLPPEVMQGHGQLPDRIAEQGGRILAGLALAKLTPIVEGGVEVRPLLGFEVVG